jgi:hypothetical protein
MRTKALLCVAGLLATVATSMTQSNVYPLNVVGYINVPFTNGFQLVANQLHSDSTATNNTVQSVFSTNVPNLTTVYAFSAGTYANGTLIGTTWNTGTAANTAAVNKGLNAGGGVWLKIPGTSGTSGSFTEVGEVHQGSTALTIIPGFNIMSLVPPLSAKIQTDMGYPPTSLDTIYRYSTTSGYVGGTYTRIGTTWNPSEPQPNIGESFWVKSAATANKTWTQTYNVP